MYNPVSTYRVQFNKAFNFAAFVKIIPYLKQLGVRTIYASPVFAATPGSAHGYDMIDPLAISPEIGTLDELSAISQTLNNLGIGWMQDIVPNHMAFHPANKWLMDVLEKGERSAYAGYFDILWTGLLYDGRIMVPFLELPFGEALAAGQIQVAARQNSFFLSYYDQNYPLNLASYLTLLKAGGCKDELSGIAKEFAKLELIADASTYAEKWTGLKNKLHTIVDEVFTKQALQKINNNPRIIKKIAEQQFYQLCYKNETDQQINFRRFFAVNELICLNIHHQEVFDHYHRLIKQMVDMKIVIGLRVDHIDGLYDPETYLKRLRKLVGDNVYIVVEKILGEREEIPPAWPVQGNTGYDFLADVNNLFTNGSAENEFSELYETFTAETCNVKKGILQKKTLILNEQMNGELNNLYRLFLNLNLAGNSGTNAVSPGIIKLAITAVLVSLPVYRFYGNNMPLSVAEATMLANLWDDWAKNSARRKTAVALLKQVLLKKPQEYNDKYNEKTLQFYRRCMQFTGPIMAKGVEDTLMYTYNRFIGHNEVGDFPGHFGIGVSEFHRRIGQRMLRAPNSINGTSTHDTKRGEDVRARLNVITDIPDEWTARVKEWQQLNARFVTANIPDANDEYLIYQTVTGAFPMPGQPEDDFTYRFKAYMVKAMREAKRNTNWAKPNKVYEDGVLEFIDQIFEPGGAFWQSFKKFHIRVADYGIINSLGQVLLKFACPGIADLYQGCELWDFSLVDPDNRRPVDFLLREHLLDELTLGPQSRNVNWRQLWDNRYNAHIKLALINLLLKERNKFEDVFAKGEYYPLKIKGLYKENIIAFLRRHKNDCYVFVVTLNLAAINRKQRHCLSFNWLDTRINLPAGISFTWKNLISNSPVTVNDDILLSELFNTMPFAILKNN
ncbi:malto-oligosyltrehalose synthase [soil metagenome]|jgi:(1->4)-alpha-D-glucan 1-alpha-D-glucosylmutase